jgi:lipopolysaccharide exporter
MSIANRAVRGAAIVLVSSYANLAMGFTTTIILARLLSPTTFGLFDLSMFFYTAFDVRNKFSLDYALVHRQPGGDDAASTHWLLQLALSAITLLIGSIASIVLPLLGYNAAMTPVLISLCAIGVIEASGSTARALLEKELRFGRSTLIVSSALLLSNLVAIGMAWAGAGIWSLVAQAAVNVTVGAVGFWRVAATRLRVSFSRDMARWMLRFGLSLALGSLASIVVLQGDNYMVGTFVSVSMLGFYGRAYKIAQWPTGLVTHVISRAALPTYAKLQDDKPRLSKAFGLTLWVIISLATPLALALFVCAPDFILLVLGETWLPSAILLRFLVGYSVLRPLLDDTGALLVATGKPQRLTQLLVVEAIALITFGLPLTLAYGATGTAIAVGITFLIGIVVAYRFVSQTVSLNLLTFCAPPLIAVCASLALYAALAYTVELNTLPLLLRVIVKGGFVAIAFLGTLVMIQRDTTVRLRYVVALIQNR